MKRTMLCLLALALLAGLALANNQQTATYDSLNVRVVWTFHGTREFGGLAMAPDTTLWTCYPGTHTLIKIDASDPDAIDTNFYEMDSSLGAIIDVYHDSILIVYVGTETDQAMLLLNINDDPPSVISRYDSPYLCFFGISRDRPWIIVDDSILITSDRENGVFISIFDISNPLDIDTFSTQTFIYGWASNFSVKDSFLYSTFCSSGDVAPPYELVTYLSVVNMADPANPFHVSHQYAFHYDYSAEVAIPSVAVDTFLFLAANYYEAPLADVYSIADPTSPRHLGAIGEYAWRYSKRVIDYQNGYLYSGMWIHDITGFPTNDSLVGYIQGEPRFLKICGKYVYQICGDTFGITEFYEYDPNHVFVPEIKAPAKPTALEISAYPNPFNSSVTIAIDGALDCHSRAQTGSHSVKNGNPEGFTVEIFDLAGRRVAVAEPVEAIEVPGEFAVPGATNTKLPSTGSGSVFVWTPAPSLPSGVYLVRATGERGFGPSTGSGTVTGSGPVATKRVVYLK